MTANAITDAEALLLALRRTDGVPLRSEIRAALASDPPSAAYYNATSVSFDRFEYSGGRLVAYGIIFKHNKHAADPLLWRPVTSMELESASNTLQYLTRAGLNPIMAARHVLTSLPGRDGPIIYCVEDAAIGRTCVSSKVFFCEHDSLDDVIPLAEAEKAIALSLPDPLCQLIIGVEGATQNFPLPPDICELNDLVSYVHKSAAWDASRLAQTLATHEFSLSDVHVSQPNKTQCVMVGDASIEVRIWNAHGQIGKRLSLLNQQEYIQAVQNRDAGLIARTDSGIKYDALRQYLSATPKFTWTDALKKTASICQRGFNCAISTARTTAKKAPIAYSSASDAARKAVAAYEAFTKRTSDCLRRINSAYAVADDTPIPRAPVTLPPPDWEKIRRMFEED